MTQDPWDYVHITCWNFLPFLLRRVGEAPAWVVRVAFAIWFTGFGGISGNADADTAGCRGNHAQS